MKNRMISISLAATLILSGGLVSCGGEGVPEIIEYNLTISSSEGGSVTAPGEGVGSFTYDEGTVVNLVAEAEEGYRFVNWTGDVGTIADVDNATTSITMNSHYSITATFGYGPAIPLRNPGSFVQMTALDVDSLDPPWAYDTASCEQVGDIYETLLSYDGEKVDQFVPVLATEWELLNDNVTYRFRIREGVKFHAGGDLTPEDVEYSFERAMVQDRSTGPIWVLLKPLLGLGGRAPGGSTRDGDGSIVISFDQIDNAVEVDGDWVVFHLVEPAWRLQFLQILCNPWASILDKEWCIAHGEWDGMAGNWTTYNNPDKTDSYLYNHTNGTGPWKLEEWEPGVRIRLVRNDDYWRDPAPFETIITQIVEDWTTRREALLAGDADLVYVPRMYVGELEGIADLDVYQGLPELSADAFFFNMAINADSTYIGSGALDGNGIPPDFFTDIDVRKGFNYAFDWEAYINDVYMGEAEQRGSPVIEGLLYYNPDTPMHSHDLLKAEEHLKLAWGGELWHKGCNFTLLYSPSNLSKDTAFKILAENLATINAKFQVSIQPMNWGADILPRIRSRLVPMFQIGWGVDFEFPHPDNFLVPFMASYGVFAKLQGYGYPELDELIDDAFRELDPEEQQNMYYEIQERYYEDAPSIMLVQPLGRRYFTKYIRGFYFNPMIPGQAGRLYYMSKSS